MARIILVLKEPGQRDTGMDFKSIFGEYSIDVDNGNYVFGKYIIPLSNVANIISQDILENFNGHDMLIV